VAGVEIATAYVTLLPDGSKLGPATVRDADRAGQTAGKRYGGAFSSSAKAILGAAGGFFAATKVLGFGADALQEAREAQVVGARTENVIKRMGGQSKITAKQVGDLSSAISERVGIDDEAIQSGANLLLTFGKIRNEQGKGNKIFNRTTRLMVDMSKAMGTDAKGAAVQLGKALNDPVKGVSALTRVGVSFEEQQKKTIKALIEGGDKNAVFALGLVKSNEEWSDSLKANKGDIAATVKALTSNLSEAQKKRYDFLAEGGHQLDAQKIILKEVEKQFGGAAKSMATPAEKAQVAYGNLKEQIGVELLPVAEDLANFFTNKAIPAVSGFLDEMKTGKGKGGQAADLFRTIRDDAKATAGFAKDIVDRFNGMPDWAKKSILVGGASLYAGNKVRNRLGAGGAGGILSKGSTPVNPLYVNVVNGGAGAGAGSGKGGAGPVGLGRLGIAAGLASAGGVRTYTQGSKFGPLGGGALDTALAKMAQSGKAKDALAGLKMEADKANISLGAMALLMPKTAAALKATGNEVSTADVKTLGLKRALDLAVGGLTRLDEKDPKVNVKDNIPDVRRRVHLLATDLNALEITRTAHIRIATSGDGFNHPGLQAGGNNYAGRRGPTFTGPINVKANSPDDFLRDMQRRNLHGSMGGS
jgi:hypothetical protein